MQSIIKNINQNNKPNCSIVIPVYNSEESLPFLAARLEQVLPEIANQFEVILVNDGSRDNSWNVILGLTSKYSWIHAINLMRNSGQHNALLCGIRAAKYEVTITLDDDLQQPPEEIHKLLAKFNEGYDVVYGSPNKLPHEFWRNFSSRFTKRIMAYVMGIPNVINIGPFRVFPDRPSKSICSLSEVQMSSSMCFFHGQLRNLQLLMSMNNQGCMENRITHSANWPRLLSSY